MFDIDKIQPIINHLQSISSYFKPTGNEIIIYCPYCDDATRINASNHGHLYISKAFPVFNCFRCSTSGTLIRLLVETDFKDEEVLKYLASFIKYKFLPDHYIKIKRKTKVEDISKMILNTNLQFEKENKQKFEIYKTYLKSRLGSVDFLNFLISPGLFYNKLTCDFINFDQELIVQRLIEKLVVKDTEIKHHLNKTSSGLYYFQEKNFDKYNEIVLAEGAFDIISLYLYSMEFKNCLFISVSGKKYLSTVEKLIIEDLLIGEYQFHLVFDNDVLDYKKQNFVYNCKNLAQKLNENISVKGWSPVLKKDTGDFPAVQQIQGR